MMSIEIILKELKYGPRGKHKIAVTWKDVYITVYHSINEEDTWIYLADDNILKEGKAYET